MEGVYAGKRKLRRRRFAAVFLCAALIVGVVAVDQAATQRSALRIEQTGTLASVAETERAIDALGKLAVKNAVSKDGYSRNQFSQGWGYLEGCDMRNRILQRDLAQVALDDDDCIVLSGVLEEDPFTGKRIEFKRGKETSNDLHIEHLVAVSDAWRKGAQELPEEKRWEFYNDPLNLVAVDGPANVQKGDKDASAWLPRPEYRCRYVARQIAVKRRYELWVTKIELNAMKRVLATCPAQVLPVQAGVSDGTTGSGE
jgi:hypothetical protein